MYTQISDEKRKKIMGSIHGKGTKLENRVSQELWIRGFRFRKNVRSLYGTPDIAIKKYKVVIFIDSCFWHACEIHGTLPDKNHLFWINKFNRNKEHDKEITDYYERMRWNIYRVWEHDLRRNLYGTVDKIEDFILVAKSSSSKRNVIH